MVGTRLSKDSFRFDTDNCFSIEHIFVNCIAALNLLISLFFFLSLSLNVSFYWFSFSVLPLD